MNEKKLLILIKQNWEYMTSQVSPVYVNLLLIYVSFQVTQHVIRRLNFKI